MKVLRLQLGEMGTNCYLLADGSEVAIIDPGFEPDRILESLYRLSAGGKRLIINTHGHIDHIGANAAVKDITGAPILIGRRDAVQLTDARSNLSFFLGQEVVSPEADRLLDEGDIITVGTTELRVIETPGHTEGSICLVGDGFAFTGDTLFFDSVGRTDFPGGSEEKLFASLRRLLAELPDETVIYPGHNEPGRLGDAKLINPFLQGLT